MLTSDQILNSTLPSEIFNMTNWSKELKELMFRYHPDTSSNPDPKVWEKLMQYKDVLEDGYKFSDEYSEITLSSDGRLLSMFCDDVYLLQTTVKNYENLVREVNHQEFVELNAVFH